MPAATFDELISTARVGDLVFFSGRRWWSRLIRFRTASRWSHVGIVTDVVHGSRGSVPLVLITEAIEGKGVRVVPADVWSTWQGSVAIGYVRLCESSRQQIADFARSQQGCRYASPRQFVRSFSLLWSRVAVLLGLRDDEDDTRWFCSELAASAIASANKLRLPKAAAKMSPGDVSEMMCVNLTRELEL